MPSPTVNRILRSKRPMFGSDKAPEMIISANGLNVSGGGGPGIRRAARSNYGFVGQKRFYGFTPSGSVSGDNRFWVGVAPTTLSLENYPGNAAGTGVGWWGLVGLTYEGGGGNSSDPWPAAANQTQLVAWDGISDKLWTWNSVTARWSGAVAGVGTPITPTGGLTMNSVGFTLYPACANDGNAGSIAFDPNPTSHSQYTALLNAGFLPVGS